MLPGPDSTYEVHVCRLLCIRPSRIEASVNYSFLLEKHDNETNHKQSGAADY